MISMKQYRFATIGIIVALVALTGVLFYMTKSDAGQQRAVRSTVETFASQLKNVPLSGEEDIAKDALADYYAPYITPELLTSWQERPVTAPGRRTSSPWPDRIEIKSIASQGAGYIVNGDIIYMTSVEVAEGGESQRVPVVIQVIKTDEGWRIAAYQEQLLP